MISSHNPAGTNGFAFLEFTTLDKNKLHQQFTSLGFIPTEKHIEHDITVYQQGNIKFLLNHMQSNMALTFAEKHGASVFSMGFRVHDAQHAFKHALSNGAQAVEFNHEENPYLFPAIYGVGGSIIYFVDDENAHSTHQHKFKAIPHEAKQLSAHDLIEIDHVTHNLYRGNMKEWADFYTRIFNFQEIRYFDIEGRLTGLKSKAMTSPCCKIRIPLNESSDDKSQIEEFLHEFHGEGIQHIALSTNNIYESVSILKDQGIQFLNTPDTYYDLIDKRLPKHGENITDLKKHRILIDGNTANGNKLLLQIFTQNMLGPVFFEIIQRKGDEGFGEGNFRALFESIELDQIKRGVLQE